MTLLKIPPRKRLDYVVAKAVRDSLNTVEQRLFYTDCGGWRGYFTIECSGKRLYLYRRGNRFSETWDDSPF